MFVWLFHRISGAVLIILIAGQLLTGFRTAEGATNGWQQFMVAWHKSPITINILAVLFIFHALYGLRTIIVDLGLQKEKPLFWVLTPIGIALYIAFVWIFYFAG